MLQVIAVESTQNEWQFSQTISTGGAQDGDGGEERGDPGDPGGGGGPDTEDLPGITLYSFRTQQTIASNFSGLLENPVFSSKDAISCCGIHRGRQRFS